MSKEDWINVDDRLPEDNECVFAYGLADYFEDVDGQLTATVEPAIFRKGYWWQGVDNELGLHDVTHWMPNPKPEPPQKGTL